MATRILCVDDEPSGLYLRKLILEKQGYEVETATTPDEALAKFRGDKFELVVTDHLLGRGTGTELARQMKAIRPEVPVVLLSGTVDIPFGLGVADAFVSKADGHEALLRKINELLKPLDDRGLESNPIQEPRLQRVLLAALVESSDDAIFSKSLNGTILTWNKAAERVYGYTAQEIIGRNVSMLVPPDLQPQFQQLMARIRRGETVDHLETRRKAKDGRELHVVLTVYPIRDEEGHILAAATTARDVTQLTLAQQALRNSDRLATAGRMAATVAHEINNPLEAVTNILYLLERAPGLDPTALDFVRTAQQEIARVRQISQLTLRYHRRPSTQLEQVSVPEMVNGVTNLYGRRLRTLGIEVESDFRGEGVVEAYAGELRQVISNLIVNAMDALEEKGTKLRLRVRDGIDARGRSGVRLTVADDAGGIGSPHLAHIFEPFYSTKGEKGTGVGLWVSRSILDKHHGSIRVKSRQGLRSGTVFSIFLARHFAHEQTRPPDS